MRLSPSTLAGVLVGEPRVFEDARGTFFEAYRRDRFAEQGLDVDFVQDNQSRSVRGVLRGLHYQLVRPQGKLVRVLLGEIYDVAVDIRVGSPTFGRWVGERLSADNRRMLYVPPGFAHGFCVLSEAADVLYKCTDYYAPDDEYGIAWNDPLLAIDWPGESFLISGRDQALRPLSEMNGRLPQFAAR